jgi:hypothetical protein
MSEFLIPVFPRPPLNSLMEGSLGHGVCGGISFTACNSLFFLLKELGSLVGQICTPSTSQGTRIRTPHLGKCSATWAMPPALRLDLLVWVFCGLFCFCFFGGGTRVWTWGLMLASLYHLSHATNLGICILDVAPLHNAQLDFISSWQMFMELLAHLNVM